MNTELIGLVNAFSALLSAAGDMQAESLQRARRCCFCGLQAESLTELKEHSGECPDHPSRDQLVILRETLRQLVASGTLTDYWKGEVNAALLKCASGKF